MADGMTPLHAACRKGNPEIVQMLLDKGALINVADRGGVTPLHLTMKWNRITATKILLQHHADYNKINAGGASPVTYAIQSKTAMCFLHMAASSGIHDLTVSLIQSMTDSFNSADINNDTALIHCCRQKNWKAPVVSLIQKGVDLRCRNKLGHTALYYALRTDPNVAQVLLEQCLSKNTLDVSNFGLTEISPDFVSLIDKLHVKVLNLSNNALRMVPPEISLISRLEKVKLDGNPLDLMPASVKTASWPKLSSYLRLLLTRAEHWNQRKIIVIGQEGVGKSTLIRAFKNRKGRVNVKENVATDGIEIHKSVNFSGNDSSSSSSSSFSALSSLTSHSSSSSSMSLQSQSSSQLSTAGGASSADQAALNSADMFFHCWDFGGQEIFYPTHQFFLTSNSIYVLVFSLADLGRSRIEYWMRHIKALAQNSPKAPIFMVGTRAEDDVVAPDVVESLVQDLQQQYRKQVFNGMQGIFPVSCKTGKGIAALKNAIHAYCQDNRMIVPSSWVKLHDLIEDVTVPYSDYKTYSDWATNCGVALKDLPMATDFLRSVGQLVYFEFPKNLRNMVIYKPQWLSSVMSSLITLRPNWVREGILHESNLNQVFSRFPANSHAGLLEILEKFDIIFRMRKENTIIVPPLLPENMPESAGFIWPSKLPSGFKEQGRCFKFPFLPIGFMTRLMVNLLHLPGIECHFGWRTGVLLSSTQQLALVTFDFKDCCCTIRVRTPEDNLKLAMGAGLMLRKIVDTTNTLIDSFYNMRTTTTQLIPCIHCLDRRMENREPFYFTFRECVDAITTGDPYVFCQHIRSSARCVSVASLCPDLAFRDFNIVRPEQLVIGSQIGSGGFGKVYKGMYNNSFEVAIKELHTTKENRESRFLEFQQESFINSVLDHPNLVKLYGLCLQPSLQMVLEYVKMGDLFHFLHPAKDHADPTNLVPMEQFPWKLRLLIAYDIALGLLYMHSFNPPIAHRDIRSPNIFLNSLSTKKDEVRAKLADFGLSRMVATELSEALRTWNWVAPEILDASSTSFYDERSDIYSLGIVFWEIATRSIPYFEYSKDDRFFSRGGWDLLAISSAIKNGLRPSLPKEEEGCPPKFASLIEKCWRADPCSRPSLTRIVKSLAKMCHISDPPIDFHPSIPAILPEVEKDMIDYEPFEMLAPDLPELETLATHCHSIPFQGAKRFPTFTVYHANVLYVGCADGMVFTFDQNGTRLYSWKAHFESVTFILVEPVPNQIWTSSSDGYICVWVRDFHQWKMALDFRPFTKSVSTLTKVTSEGKTLVWVSSNQFHIISVHSVEQVGHLEKTIILDQEAVNSTLQVDKYVWVASGNRISLYDLDYQAVAFFDTKDMITCITLSGDTVWTGSRDGEITAWSYKNDNFGVVKSMRTHTSPIISISCERSVMVTAASDSVIFWDAPSKQALQEISHHSDNITSCSLSSGMCYTASVDKTVAIWRVTPSIKRSASGDRTSFHTEFDVSTLEDPISPRLKSPPPVPHSSAAPRPFMKASVSSIDVAKQDETLASKKDRPRARTLQRSAGLTALIPKKVVIPLDDDDKKDDNPGGEI